MRKCIKTDCTERAKRSHGKKKKSERGVFSLLPISHYVCDTGTGKSHSTIWQSPAYDTDTTANLSIQEDRNSHFLTLFPASPTPPIIIHCLGVPLCSARVPLQLEETSATATPVHSSACMDSPTRSFLANVTDALKVVAVLAENDASCEMISNVLKQISSELGTVEISELSFARVRAGARPHALGSPLGSVPSACAIPTSPPLSSSLTLARARIWIGFTPLTW